MKKLPRRLVLKGLGGALIGLPLLESQSGWAQARLTPKRFVVFFEHGGTVCGTGVRGNRIDGKGGANGVDAWGPSQQTEALKLGTIHSTALAGLESSLLLTWGIDNRAAMAQPNPGNPGGGHHISNATALTAAVARVAPGVTLTDFGLGSDYIVSNPSIDGVLAQRLKIRNPVPYASINFEVPFTKWGTYGSPFYSPHPTQAGASIPTPSKFNPIKAFKDLFPAQVVSRDGGSTVTGPSAQDLLDHSVLDGTKEMLELYKGQVSSADIQTIDAHLTNLREIELRLASLEQTITSMPGCQRPTVNESRFTESSSRASLETLGNITTPLLVDIGVAAMRCGLTNVFTLELSDMVCPWTNPTYVSSMGHAIGHSSATTGATGTESHRAASWLSTMISNRQWRMTMFARILKGLKEVPEGEGRTMLDNTIALETSEQSNAGAHTSINMPVLLAGGKGVLRTNRYVNFNSRAAANPNTSEYSSNASLHNLFTTILRAFDYTDEHFGSAASPNRGVLSGILA